MPSTRSQTARTTRQNGITRRRTPARAVTNQPTIQRYTINRVGTTNSSSSNTAVPLAMSEPAEESSAIQNEVALLDSTALQQELEGDQRPLPFAEPIVWAESRLALCETLPWYRAYQSGLYSINNIGYGFLLDKDNGTRGYLDEEVAITRAGGGYKPDANGEMFQAENQTRGAANINSLEQNRVRFFPVGLILGSSNSNCQIQVPHRYCVMDWFQVTDIWAEKCDGKIGFKFRFEKIDLDHKSWWAAAGSPLPASERGLITAKWQKCTTCNKESKQIYEVGFICLNEACHDFWKLGARSPPDNMKFDGSFLAERTPWTCGVKPSFELKPTRPTYDPSHPESQYSLQNARGIVCPNCGRCISRARWFLWKCNTKGCDFIEMIKLTPVSPLSVMKLYTVEYAGHAVPLDKWTSPVSWQHPEFFGNWRIETYEILQGNIISHFMANKPLNEQRGGAHEMFEAIQQTDISLERFPMASCAISTEMLTSHFSSNFGMPYKYLVAVNSKSFSEAPPFIMNGVNKLTWAGQHTVRTLNNMPNTEKPHKYMNCNELLALGYLEQGSINYHDDGEKDLGPTIATMSLGCEATMSIRLKKKYLSIKKINWSKYDPKKPVIAGSRFAEERLRLNKMYNERVFNRKDLERLKTEVQAKVCADKTNFASPCLTMKLKHGDMVVMHGSAIQKYYEHRIEPEGLVRFALTSRYIKPENIPESEHWKGEFSIPAEAAYDGLKETSLYSDISTGKKLVDDSDLSSASQETDIIMFETSQSTVDPLEPDGHKQNLSSTPYEDENLPFDVEMRNTR